MEQDILKKTRRYVRSILEGEGSGHDWWHIHRVVCNAKLIGAQENADMFIVELAALLHDIGDHKLHGGDHTVGPRMVREWLTAMNVDEEIITHVAQIVADLSFKGSKVKTPMKTIEGMIVQDADRLDAIGAIGVARAFAYGGHSGQLLHDPNAKPTHHHSFEQYKNTKTTTINHFHEKLFLLKERMNTNAAKKIAHERHAYMEQFVKQFHLEWNGKC